jgi:hypothetical protein
LSEIPRRRKLNRIAATPSGRGFVIPQNPPLTEHIQPIRINALPPTRQWAIKANHSKNAEFRSKQKWCSNQSASEINFMVERIGDHLSSR